MNHSGAPQSNKRLKLTGGEWIGLADEQLGGSLLCAACYDEAKELNFPQRPRRGAV